MATILVKSLSSLPWIRTVTFPSTIFPCSQSVLHTLQRFPIAFLIKYRYFNTLTNSSRCSLMTASLGASPAFFLTSQSCALPLIILKIFKLLKIYHMLSHLGLHAVPSMWKTLPLPLLLASNLIFSSQLKHQFFQKVSLTRSLDYAAIYPLSTALSLSYQNSSCFVCLIVSLPR